MRPRHALAALMPAMLLALALAPAARAAESCLVVYGQGRNIGETAAQNEAWDALNARFNLAVTTRLRAAGLDAQPLFFRVAVTEPAAAVQQLVARAEALACTRVVDTAVFADAEGALVVRLRVHPLLGQAGPVVLLNPSAPARIGAPLFTGQSEFDLNERTLERLRLEALADAQVGAYLEQAGATIRPPAAAASRSR